MRNGQLDRVLHYLRDLLAARQARELPDRALLDCFVAHHDQAAFAAIVERHGPVVMGVCRRTLRSEHDAEDACQATFLVLARKASSIRKRESLGCWLHGVAYRVARKLRTNLQRRTARDASRADQPRPDFLAEITWREGLAVLDEELERLPATYRSALILCYLEGKTQDEAAQELGCSLGVLRGRLERARQCLRSRLLRRGVGLPATLLGTILASTQTSSAVPPTLAIATARAATMLAAGQCIAPMVPAHVAALTQGVLKAMLLIRLEMFVTVGIVASLLSVGAAVLPGVARNVREMPAKTESTSRPPSLVMNDKTTSPAPKTISDDKTPQEQQTIRSLVRDAAGKPVAGARVFWAAGVPPKQSNLALPKNQRSAPKIMILSEGQTGTDGQSELRARFASGTYPEMLLVATAPGYGVAGKRFTASKDPLAITLRPELKIKGQLLTPAGAPAKGVRVRLMSVTFGPQESVAIGFRATDPTPPYWPAAVFTDDQGRFTMDGFSEDAGAHLILTHDEFAQEDLYVSSMSKVMESHRAFDIQPLKPEFRHTMQPARPVQGMVKAADTGKPLAGIVVEVVPWGSHGGQVFDGRTDAEGHYRVSGHAATTSPPFATYTITVSPPADSGYLCLTDNHEKGWPAGAKFLEKNFTLPRGRLLRGRVLDTDTGKPIAGVSIVYQPKPGNPHNRSEYDLRNPVLTDNDGRFAITGLAGNGVLVAEGPSADYQRVSMPKGETEWDQELFPHGYVRVDVPDKGEPSMQEIKLRKGVTLEAKIVGPDSSALPWVYAGCPVLQACQINRWETSVRFDKGLFRMPGCDPSRSYRVFFIQPELHLGAVADLNCDGKPAEVRLQPTGSVRGKLVHADGSPARNYQAYPLLLLTKEDRKFSRRDWFDRDRFLIYGNLTQTFVRPQQNVDGSFVVEDLIAGSPFYIVGAADRLSVRVPVTLKPGEVKDLGSLTLAKEEER